MALAWMAVGLKPAADWGLSVVARAKPKGRAPGRLWTTEEPGYRGSFEVGDKTRDLACEIEAAVREAGWLIGPGGGRWGDVLIVAINQKSFDQLKAALVDDPEEWDVSMGRALGYPESAIQAYARREEPPLESLIPDELSPIKSSLCPPIRRNSPCWPKHGGV